MKKQKDKKEEKTNSILPLPLEKPKIIEIKDPQITEKKENVEVKKDKPVEEVIAKPLISVTQPKIDPKFTAISTYNGDSCDQYNWSQGSNDVSIQINLLENTSASKVI